MNKNFKFITKSYKETRKLGEKLAEEIKKGTVVALYGDLGSGKTTFVQGFAKGLKIKKRLISPTFIILRTYKIRLKTKNLKLKTSVQEVKNFYHVDLYRIQNGEDIREIGLDEIIENGNDIVAIEWAEKLGYLLPKKRIDIYFKSQDDTREITINKNE
ncbi:MAG: tRNA (adenosine(37)-N6)-threonylcarbamoyltransferase complex ATPase subunit type 1 TsaE [Candidatus Levybacteria bacterium CG_4_9_14_3_um_filter_35_16]|nr:MAG: tRNA (adenosine(37)-N6)-threonylcarbamoyltransferase complex ATPase subunit type 1 TsaE [Candidatus Levybacteria bacterium CG22_combo_CG10-13_8_21_14_all_35_11]PJA91110.1 MAG: tRNA (adenosine(37)-N6)-threonylcarbamoyltransferase complex ATPase subunit type 1 TsaE [Candidatus Levybacteria bacterium CG_4_9_14_3_um_filter_35_16]